MKLIAGISEPNWLCRAELEDIPVMINAHRMERLRKDQPSAVVSWVLDPGGYTSIERYGGWRGTDAEYASTVNRWARDLGGLLWTTARDWMCEPPHLRRTGLSVEEHQRRTIASFLTIRERCDVPVLPILQGWEEVHYRRHVDMYLRAGVDLALEPLVGVGSVCNRQDTAFASRLFQVLAQEHGLRMHGFGLKSGAATAWLTSGDSMWWSYRARSAKIRLAGCRHQNCNQCPLWLRMAYQQRIATLRDSRAPMEMWPIPAQDDGLRASDRAARLRFKRPSVSRQRLV